MNANAKQAILFISVLLSRLPFLFAGYGVEEDSWGHVLQTALISENGTYDISRLPGHPLYEALLLILWNVHGPFTYNLLSALASAGSATVLFRLLEFYKSNGAFWWSFVFSLIPVVFITSTYTIDYSITLLFTLLSFEAVLKNNYSQSAIWLAVAAGFRITALGMLAPIALIIIQNKSAQSSKAIRLRNIFKVTFIATALSVLFYIPPFSRYGLGFFNFHRPPYPTLLEATYKMTIGVWGSLGFFTLAILCILLLFKKNKIQFKKQHGVWLLVALIYGIAYFRMPEKAAFWLPVIPFSILFLAEQLNQKSAIAIGSVLILSSFFFGINKTDSHTGSNFSSYAITFGSNNGELFFDPLNGPVMNDYSKRINKMAACERIEYQLMIQRQRTSVIAGWWYAMLEVNKREGLWSNRNIKLFYRASPEELADLKARGYQLRYLPDQGMLNDQKYNSNYTVNNATELAIE